MCLGVMEVAMMFSLALRLAFDLSLDAFDHSLFLSSLRSHCGEQIRCPALD